MSLENQWTSVAQSVRFFAVTGCELAAAHTPHVHVAVTEAKHFLPIHREAPSFQDQGTEQEILVTGIKVCLVLQNTFPGLLFQMYL